MVYRDIFDKSSFFCKISVLVLDVESLIAWSMYGSILRIILIYSLTDSYF